MSSPFKNREEMVEHPEYDADFTIDINKKMTVPSKLHVANNAAEIIDDPAVVAIHHNLDVNSDQNFTEIMQVPDCIRIAGGESHITTNRDPPPEMKMEDKLFGKPNDDSTVQLLPIPRTLLYQDAEPIFAQPIKQLDRALNTTKIDQSTKINNTTIFNAEIDDPELGSQNLALFRRRILQLSHRIEAIEFENRRRDKREFLLYTIGAIYLLFRGLTWMFGRGQRFTM